MAQTIWGVVTAILVLLLYVAVLLYRRYRTDLLRHRLFVLRDQLFQLGLNSEKLSFNDPVYRELEAFLCKMLRFAHQVSFTLIVVALFSGLRPAPTDRTVSAMQRVLSVVEDQDLRQALMNIWLDAGFVVLKHLMTTSFLMMGAFGAVGLYALARTLSMSESKNAIVAKGSPAVSEIESMAYAN